MKQLVLLRHGESVWNKENRFTGWTDVALSDQGRAEAAEAGKRLKDAGFVFDVAHTSVLKRAIHTLWLALDQMEQPWIPVHPHWRLNERHYGALQGLNKAETADEFGDEQVRLWRRSYDVPPPALAASDDRHPANDSRYRSLAQADLPLTECLKDTVDRLIPHWNDVIAPSILRGERVVVTAHGNSLRALIKHLDKVSDEDIIELNIPTGTPLVYELSDALEPIRSYYL